MMEWLIEILGIVSTVCGNFVGRPFSDGTVYEAQAMIDRMLVELKKEKYIDFEHQMNVERWESEDGWIMRALVLKISGGCDINLRIVFDPKENEIKVERVKD